MTKQLTIFIILLISSYGQVVGQSKELNSYTLKAETIGTVSIKGKIFLVIITTLTNHSKDTLKYHSKSCSWQDYFSVNKTDLEIETAECDKNITIVLTLAPGQSRQVELRLQTKGETIVSQMKFRVGFHLLQDRVYMDNYEVSEEFRKNVIWSNEISK